MNKWITFWVVLLSIFDVRGQDLTGLIEKAPTVTMILVRVLERSPSFSAKVQVNATSKSDPMPTAASGMLEFDKGNMRWEANLDDITSGQLTTQSRAAARQISGDHFLLLTRPDKMATYFILPRAQCCLEERLPAVLLSKAKTVLDRELVNGRLCRKEKLTARVADAMTNQVVVWTQFDSKGPPFQVQISDGTDEFRIRLTEVKLEPVGPARFHVPGGLATYTSFEDLIQSVVLDRLKRRMGLNH